MQKLYEWYDWDSLLTCELLFPILLIKSRCSFLFRSKYIYAAVLWMSRSLFFFSKKVKESQTGGVPKAPRSQPFRPACFQENYSSIPFAIWGSAGDPSCIKLLHARPVWESDELGTKKKHAATELCVRWSIIFSAHVYARQGHERLLPFSVSATSSSDPVSS